MYKSAASAADKDAMEQIGKNINNSVLEGDEECLVMFHGIRRISFFLDFVCKVIGMAGGEGSQIMDEFSD